jgi:long-chain acyl-CoA synthetase
MTDYLAEFEQYGSDTAFVTSRGYRRERVSYRDVAESASQFGRELASRDIGKGQRVVIWGQNSAEWVMAFLGSIQCGVVPVPIDAFASTDVAANVVREVSPALLVCAERLARAFNSDCAGGGSGFDSRLSTDKPDPAACAGTGRTVLGVPVIELESLRETVSRHPRKLRSTAAISASDPLEIIFTSGATSKPRGVVITHGNIASNLAPFKPEIRKYLKYERFVHPIGFLNLVPLSHVFGQFMGVFIPPLLGGTVHFLGTLSPSEILKTIRRERISVLVTVPRLVESLAEKVNRNLEALEPTLKFSESFDAAARETFFRRWWRFRRLHLRLGWKFWVLVCGGAALDPETETFWSRLGFVVAQGYGLTETASLISLNHPFDAQQGSIGKLLPGEDLKLDEHGEILVRGANVAAAYWCSNQLEPVLSKDRWFHTGDIGEIDSSGRLYFKGRRKRVIVTPEGMNVFPEDLEAALRRQPEVKACVVTGLERDGNSVPHAALILRGPGASAAAAIRRANAGLESYQQIRHWMIWPEEDFPRTATLKPRLAEIEEKIRQMMQSGDASCDGSNGNATSADPERLSSTIAALIESVTGRRVPADSDAGRDSDLNLTSIERVEVLSSIEERYQVELDETEFTAATTLGDLERLVGARTAEPGSANADGPSLAAARIHSSEAGVLRTNAPHGRNSPAATTFPRWAQTRLMNALRIGLYYLFVWPARTLLGMPRIEGRDHLRGVRGPVLVVANHVFMIDVGYVLAALPWRFRHRLTVAMDGKLLESFHRPPAETGFARRIIARSKYFLLTTIFNVFPLPPTAAFRSSFAYAGESVDRGYSVLVFPEGVRTTTGEIGPFRTGIGILAGNLNIPVVPMRLTGLYPFKGRHIAPPLAIRVRVGPPITFPPGSDATIITKELERRVAGLGASG